MEHFVSESKYFSKVSYIFPAKCEDGEEQLIWVWSRGDRPQERRGQSGGRWAAGVTGHWTLWTRRSFVSRSVITVSGRGGLTRRLAASPHS